MIEIINVRNFLDTGYIGVILKPKQWDTVLRCDYYTRSNQSHWEYGKCEDNKLGKIRFNKEGELRKDEVPDEVKNKFRKILADEGLVEKLIQGVLIIKTRCRENYNTVYRMIQYNDKYYEFYINKNGDYIKYNKYDENLGIISLNTKNINNLDWDIPGKVEKYINKILAKVLI